MTCGIQEAIDALPPEGGTVFIPAGVYLLKAGISLRSNVRLVGEGFSTILRHTDETVSLLAEDADEGQNQVVVSDSSTFEVGMDVIVTDDDCGVGWNVKLAEIIAIDGDTITLDSNLESTMDVDKGGLVANVFPVVKADGYSSGTTWDNVLVENLKIEGNRENVGKYTWQQAGISFLRTRLSTIRNVWVDQSSFEGISDQGVGDTFNTITDNTITGAAGTGIHLGTIYRHFTVSGNTIRDCGDYGLYFCNVVQYGYVANNTITGNLGHGIGGIDDSGYESDSYNVIEGNIINQNGLHGIETRRVAHITIANNMIARNSQQSPGACAGISLEEVSGSLVSSNEVLDTDGPGIVCSGSELTIVNNLVASNDAGGLRISDSTVELVNNTIAGNTYQESGGGIHCDQSDLTITNGIIWGNTPDQLYLESGDPPAISYCDIQGGYSGTGNIDIDPLFTSGPMGDFYIAQTASGQSTDSPCLDAGGTSASDTCFTFESETTCLNQLTTSSCHGEESSGVDLGFHYDARRFHTLSANLACSPTAGTLPMILTIDCTLTNKSAFNRLGRAVISVNLAGGRIISNWRSGTSTFGPESSYHTIFSLPIPAFSSVIGRNSFMLSVDDLTPPPYNQPPYAPSGDQDTDLCTMEGFAP